MVRAIQVEAPARSTSATLVPDSFKYLSSYIGDGLNLIQTTGNSSSWDMLFIQQICNL